MARTERLVVDLPAELVVAVRREVAAGAFGSESEAIEFLLRGWLGSDKIAEPEIAALRAFVAEGLADVEAGRLVDADEVHAELRARIEAITHRHE